VKGKRMPRWPLALIGAPAAVAVWSGWVGLGQLCGFGVIRPLPGIWDSAHLNTAITLPIGVEAYGAYALGAWLTPGTSEHARRFARWSAVGALGLGMLGQVTYHLLAARHPTRAPWPITTLVSCLPVVALALGTALAHLLREPANEPQVMTETMPATVSESVPVPLPETVPLAVPARRAPAAKAKSPTRVFAAEIERGEIPSLRAIKARAKCGTDRARVIRDQLAQALQAGPEAA
jgi:hypothetical protein